MRLLSRALFVFSGSVLIFAADIHLRPEAEAETSLFERWASRMLAEGSRLYILGDLFDYWYSGLERRFTRLLEVLATERVLILRGNRDFLLGNRHLAGLHVAEREEVVIEAGSRRILACHGHTLTVADSGFRLLHRYGWPALSLLDRALPYALKEPVARLLVSSSRVVRASSLDVPPGIHRARGVDLVVCGHLHRAIEREGLVALPAFCETPSWLAWDPGSSAPPAIQTGAG